MFDFFGHVKIFAEQRTNRTAKDKGLDTLKEIIHSCVQGCASFRTSALGPLFSPAPPSCRPLINKLPPLNRDCNRDPNVQGLKKRESLIALNSSFHFIFHYPLYSPLHYYITPILPL